jgi:DNA-binding CsgD family transcriptional regulator
MSPDERQETANRLYSEGQTQQEIANRLGVSQKTVSNDLSKK